MSCLCGRVSDFKKKISQLGGEITYCPVFLPETKFGVCCIEFLFTLDTSLCKVICNSESCVLFIFCETEKFVASFLFLFSLSLFYGECQGRFLFPVKLFEDLFLKVLIYVNIDSKYINCSILVHL